MTIDLNTWQIWEAYGPEAQACVEDAISIATFTGSRGASATKGGVGGESSATVRRLYNCKVQLSADGGQGILREGATLALIAGPVAGLLAENNPDPEDIVVLTADLLAAQLEKRGLFYAEPDKARDAVAEVVGGWTESMPVTLVGI